MSLDEHVSVSARPYVHLLHEHAHLGANPPSQQHGLDLCVQRTLTISGGDVTAAWWLD
jgi:hypothetical protein